jgi:hypothetical protein
MRRRGWFFDEAFRISTEGGVQGDLASGLDGVGLAVMHLVGRHQPKARWRCAWLYQAKKARQNILASSMQPKDVANVG